MTIHRLTRLFLTVLFLLATAGLVSAQSIPTRIADVKRISVDELRRLQAREPVLIIDTRAPGQWVRAKDKLPGAIRLTALDDMRKFAQDIPADRAIVTYCT